MLALLLVVSVVGGGSSQESGRATEVVTLIALPAIAWAVQRLLWGERPDAACWAWLAFVALLVAIPALQLLPMPDGFGSGGVARAAIANDLVAFGVERPARVSLAPQATASALFAVLPPLALFLLSASLPPTLQRRAIALVVGLALASLVLGIVQLGAPQESVLNPFPQWQPALGGFFANPNHQATLLVVAAVLATSTLGRALRARSGGYDSHPGLALGAAFVLLLCIVALPLTGSRAGVIILVIACAAMVAVQWPGGRGRRWLVAGCALAMLGGAWAAARWMQVDNVDELRGPLRDATTAIAASFAPLGSGVGSFVPVFEQHAPAALMAGEYINHAHNEYLQWWLEAGMLALLAMAVGAIALVLNARALWRLPGPGRGIGVAALIALLAVLAHSIVDYPLRTPAMLAVAAVLAGLVAAQGCAKAGARTIRPGIDPRRVQP